MSNPNEAPILVHTEDGLCTITFNRPAKKNAFTVEMYERCTTALQQAHADDSVRAILFRGQGGVFTSGNDLVDFMNAPPAGEDSAVFRFLLALAAAEKPLVSCIEGLAIGIGVTLNLHCDLVYAADTARFHLPFVSLGLVPEGGSSLLLPRMAGHARAAEVLLLSEPFDATTAREIGIVTRTVPASELAATVDKACRRLVDLPASAVRASKRLMQHATASDVQTVLRAEGDIFTQRLKSPEAVEAFTAFFEKRKPNFRQFS